MTESELNDLYAAPDSALFVCFDEGDVRCFHVVAHTGCYFHCRVSEDGTDAADLDIGEPGNLMPSPGLYVMRDAEEWSYVDSGPGGDDHEWGINGTCVPATIADITSFGLDEDGLRQSMQENLELEFGQGPLLDAIVRGAIYESLPTP